MKKRSREMKPRKQTLMTKLSGFSAPHLIKHLASCNDTVRSHSLRLLQSHISQTSDISQIVSDLDIKKLWKGLFYCLWHCDKAPAQSELINRLTDLLAINWAFAVKYFEGFLLTMRREWSGVDHLRLDKFYLCIRRFVKAVFALVAKSGWDLGLLGDFVDVLEFKVFLDEANKLGNGVGYHVVGVFLDELRGCAVPVRREVVDLLFRPFFRVLQKSLDKILIGKVRGLVFEELLKIGGGLLDRKRNGGGEEEGYDDVAFGLIAMRMGFAARFYEIGSSDECVQGNRKVVLKLHGEFLKLEKRFESAGVEIEIPNAVPETDDDDKEVPELIPIDGSEKKGEDSVIDSNGGAEEGEDILDDVEDTREHKKARKESGCRVKKEKIKKKKKEKNNRSLDDNSLVSEDCARVRNELVEASLTQESESSTKKRKKNKKKNVAVDTNDSEASLSSPVDAVLVNKSSSSCEQEESNGNVLNESVIANLQKQFENVAAELGSDNESDDDFSLSDAFLSIRDTPTIKKKKNKKRAKSCDPQHSVNEVEGGVDGAKSVGGSGSGSVKKVRFAMKNNLVWKPHSPLPPQSLRIPPSVTPRGSALKKGVLPGPIREIPPAKKKLKRKGKKMLTRTVPWR